METNLHWVVATLLFSANEVCYQLFCCHNWYSKKFCSLHVANALSCHHSIIYDDIQVD